MVTASKLDPQDYGISSLTLGNARKGCADTATPAPAREPISQLHHADSRQGTHLSPEQYREQLCESRTAKHPAVSKALEPSQHSAEMLQSIPKCPCPIPAVPSGPGRYCPMASCCSSSKPRCKRLPDNCNTTSCMYVLHSYRGKQYSIHIQPLQHFETAGKLSVKIWYLDM